MLPPGRRRNVALSPLTFCLALLVLFVSTASAASSVLGIDFGTLNFKAVLVKPGIPLEIVLTKDSKRKETAAVAFKPSFDSKKNIIAEVDTFPERLYGGDALALQARIPGEVFPNLKPLLGLAWSDNENEAVTAYHSRYPAVQAKQSQENGTVLVKSAAFVESEAPWSVEELLAMQLANVKKNAEAMAGKDSVVRDAVVTVPVFYTADEKRAIETAATLAGINVLGLISDGLAVGLDYAKSRTFPEITKGEKAEHHLVFDMGAGSTTATVLRFQARSVKDVGRFNKTVQEVAVVGAGWDRTLGGDALNNIVLTDYLYKFATKPVMKNRGIDADQVRQNPRAMSRLWKDAEKARQVLSANTETGSSFEELLPEIDFRGKISRSEFEEHASSFAERIANPINDALAAATLTFDDIDTIILHGGTVRTPFVQRKLEEIAGGSSKIRSNVNSDESAVFGAAFKGAGLSPSFKVKEIRDSDIAAYPMGITYLDGDKDRVQMLFNPTSPVGNGASTKQITFRQKEDFSFGFLQQISNIKRSITEIQTTNLTAGVKELKDKFGCDKDEISTKFNIKLSPVDGLPMVVGGTVSCEVEGSGKAEGIGESVKGWLGLGKKNQERLNEGEEDEGPVEEVDASSTTSTPEAGASAESSSSTPASSSKTPEKPKKRTESVPVSITVTTQGNPQPPPQELLRMRRRLIAFDQSDDARFAREEALNVLEGFTYYVRDFLTNSDYSDVSTTEQRQTISTLLNSVREFMEDPKEVSKATEETFREKLRELKALVEPIQARRKEGLALPKKIESFKKDLTSAEGLIKKMGNSITEASSKLAAASEAAASSTSSETTTTTAESVSSNADDLSDLEEPETTSATTTTTAKPLPSTFEEFSAYTDADLARLSDAWEAASAWLSEQEAAQTALAAHEDPVLRVADIEEQAKELSYLVREMRGKRVQIPRSSKTKKSTSKTKKSSKTSSSTTTATDAEESSVTTDDADLPSDAPVPEEEIPDHDGTETNAEEGSKRDEL